MEIVVCIYLSVYYAIKRTVILNYIYEQIIWCFNLCIVVNLYILTWYDTQYYNKYKFVSIFATTNLWRGWSNFKNDVTDEKANCFKIIYIIIGYI